MRKIYIIFLSSLLILSCRNNQNEVVESEIDVAAVPLSKADSVIKLSQMAHGVAVFEKHMFEFSFREKQYRFSFQNEGFIFNRIDSAKGDLIHDHFSNEEFWRIKNGQNIELFDDDINKYKASINSVIYFVTLPYKLSDASVISDYKGQDTIKSELYDVVEVRFSAEGGGEDHDDVFYYWFNTNNYLIDYFAYQYHTNGGGVRFREAYHRTNVGSAVFQDYINYEVPVETTLAEIPALFEQDSLKELSRIENTDIKVVP